MKKEKKKAPTIRFRGFTDDWEQRKLSTVTDCIDTGKSKFSSKKSGLYKILGSTSIIGYDDTYDYEGNFLLTARVGANAGNLYRYAGKVKISDNTVFIQSKHIDFLFCLLTHFDIKKLSFGTGQPLIKASELRNLQLLMPVNDSEKEKIGKVFSDLDNFITLHQRKLDQLKKLKKYFLQNMFPAKGEKVPRIRFKGFTGDWEQHKLYEIGQIITGTTPPTSDAENYNGDLLFVSPADIDDNRYITKTITTVSEKGFNTGREIRKGASLFVSIGSSIGKVAQMAEKAITNQQINAVVPNDNYDEDFVFSLLETQSSNVKAIASNQAVPIVNKSTFSNIDVLVPPNITEQQKMGKYFANLDNLITLHQRKLDQFQMMKKFMLQNLFI